MTSTLKSIEISWLLPVYMDCKIILKLRELKSIRRNRGNR